jgi:hypothetical protein
MCPHTTICRWSIENAEEEGESVFFFLGGRGEIFFYFPIFLFQEEEEGVLRDRNIDRVINAIQTSSKVCEGRVSVSEHLAPLLLKKKR